MVEYRLVGGSVSPPHAWPWTVQILWNSGRHCCGGALIEADIAVSAAHCFRRKYGFFFLLSGRMMVAEK